MIEYLSSNAVYLTLDKLLFRSFLLVIVLFCSCSAEVKHITIR